jgi:uncharacterized protein YjiS (DUF1127 family)
MSRIKTTSPNSSITGAGTPRTGTDKPDTAPKSRFRPDVTEAEKRHPPIASEFFGPRMFDLELPAQLTGAADEAVFRGPELDIDPQSRTIIMLPPRPRGHFGTRRQTPAMIRPEAYREREIPGFDEISRQAPDMEAGTPPRARNELEDFFENIESAPAPRPSWSKRFLGLFVSAWSFWRREREISRSIAALSAMDDQILRDIGIEHRLQIPEIVRHGRGRA